MDKVLRNLICIVFIRSTKHIQTFSRRCLENLHFHSRGHIMPFYQGFWIRLQERGMRKRRLEELGVCGLFKGMLNHNIIYEDIARYSVLHGNEQLFASKYKLYLPTEEELRAEIETQKAMFYLQQQECEEYGDSD